MSIEAMKQALEAFEDLRDNHGIHYVNEIVDLRTAIEEAEKPKYDPIELHVLHSHIAGVLFDFMGWLTTREKRLTLSSTDEAGPAVEAITAFAKMRGLRLEDAQVEHWQTILTTPPAAPVQDIGVEQDERVFARIAARKNRDAAHMETAPRQWVGLSVYEARNFYESILSRAELINKIDEFLEEKNT